MISLNGMIPMASDNKVMLQECGVPSYVFSTTLCAKGKENLHKMIVNEEYIDELGVVTDMYLQPKTMNQSAYTRLLANLMGKELALVGERVYVVALGKLADILDGEEEYWLKKINTPRYVILTGFYDGGDFPLDKRDGLRIREWVLNRLDNTNLGVILQGNGSLLKSSEWWGAPFATELVSRVTVMEFSE